MAKSNPKPKTKGDRNTDRRSGKAPKKNPKPNNYGATGKTVDGYGIVSRAIRADKRENPSKYVLKGLTQSAK